MKYFVKCCCSFLLCVTLLFSSILRPVPVQAATGVIIGTGIVLGITAITVYATYNSLTAEQKVYATDTIKNVFNFSARTKALTTTAFNLEQWTVKLWTQDYLSILNTTTLSVIQRILVYIRDNWDSIKNTSIGSIQLTNNELISIGHDTENVNIQYEKGFSIPNFGVNYITPAIISHAYESNGLMGTIEQFKTYNYRTYYSVLSAYYGSSYFNVIGTTHKFRVTYFTNTSTSYISLDGYNSNPQRVDRNIAFNKDTGLVYSNAVYSFNLSQIVNVNGYPGMLSPEQVASILKPHVIYMDNIDFYIDNTKVGEWVIDNGIVEDKVWVQIDNTSSGTQTIADTDTNDTPFIVDLSGLQTSIDNINDAITDISNRISVPTTTIEDSNVNNPSIDKVDVDSLTDISTTYIDEVDSVMSDYYPEVAGNWFLEFLGGIPLPLLGLITGAIFFWLIFGLLNRMLG